MLLLLAALIFVYNLGFTLVRLRGDELSAAVEFMYHASFLCGVGWWLQSELRRHRVHQLYCRGLFLQVGWPIVITYYLLKTRRAKGLIPIAILFGSFLLAQFVAVVIYVVVKPDK
ncbi:MAG TPA: hypothetical protein VGQ39_22960 [Pyrinomonadaceae bacterium]|nr:hypothetical protein [Pyrinomonadaceae bacterium]